jgi:hypothetical protein
MITRRSCRIFWRLLIELLKHRNTRFKIIFLAKWRVHLRNTRPPVGKYKGLASHGSPWLPQPAHPEMRRATDPGKNGLTAGVILHTRFVILHKSSLSMCRDGPPRASPCSSPSPVAAASRPPLIGPGSYRPTTDDNVQRKRRYMPPKTTGIVAQL